MVAFSSSSTMSKSSLSSVLVRASAGSTVSRSMVTAEELDRHVAELILKEAKQKAERYSKQGIRAYLPDLTESNAPRTNKRFLYSIIRSTDDHNKTILQAQALAAQEIKREREEEERRARAEAAKRSSRSMRWDDAAGSWDRRRDSKRKRRHRNPDDDEEEHERRKSGERKKRRHRSRSKESGRIRDSPEPRSRRSVAHVEECARSHKRRRRDRSGSEDGDAHRRREHRRGEPDRDHKHRSSRRRSSPSRRRRSRSLDSEVHEGYRDRDCSRAASRSRSDRSVSPYTEAEADARRKFKDKPKREHDDDDASARRTSDKCSTAPVRRGHTPNASPSSSRTTMSGAPLSCSPSPNPPPPPAQLPSKMDRYFEDSYDPRLDVAPLTVPTVPATGLIDNTVFEGWDAMLELLRIRREDKAEKKRLERLGLTKDKKKGSDSTSKDGNSIMEIEYKKRGSVREWDLGKEGLTEDKTKGFVGSDSASSRWAGEGSSTKEIEYKKRGSVRDWDFGKEGL